MWLTLKNKFSLEENYNKIFRLCYSDNVYVFTRRGWYSYDLSKSEAGAFKHSMHQMINGLTHVMSDPLQVFYAHALEARVHSEVNLTIGHFSFNMKMLPSGASGTFGGNHVRTVAGCIPVAEVLEENKWIIKWDEQLLFRHGCVIEME